MNKKRKIWLVGLFMVVAISAHAQLDWGIKAGLNLSTFSGFKAPAPEVEQSMTYGFHAGLAVQYMFTPQVGIESGLFYTVLGSKITGTVPVQKGVCTFNPSYIQLPVSLLYKFKLADDLYLYPSLGLYAGYGIGGKWKAVYTGIVNFENEKNLFGKVEADGSIIEVSANRLDIGLTAGITLQVNRITIGAGFDQGLSTFAEGLKPKSAFGEGAFKNRNIKVSIGYFF